MSEQLPERSAYCVQTSPSPRLSLECTRQRHDNLVARSQPVVLRYMLVGTVRHLNETARLAVLVHGTLTTRIHAAVQ